MGIYEELLCAKAATTPYDPPAVEGSQVSEDAMSRKRTSWAVRTQREALAQQRVRDQAHRVQLRSFQAAQREQLRLDKSRAKEYAEARATEAAEMTDEVEARIATKGPRVLPPEGPARRSSCVPMSGP